MSFHQNVAHQSDRFSLLSPLFTAINPISCNKAERHTTHESHAYIMPKTTLSDLKIRALKSDRQADFWDSKTPGFGIRVSSRSKTFIANRNGTRQTLGHYPAISLQEARRRFFALKALTDTDNPQISVQQARSEFLTQDRWKASSRKEVTRILMRHFHWEKPIDRITVNDVATAIDAIKAPKEAQHALVDVKAFFNWCVPR
ncbi:MAG: Arm DNA-binding domain-containing protein, partial [Rhodoplanes sp.]